MNKHPGLGGTQGALPNDAQVPVLYQTNRLDDDERHGSRAPSREDNVEGGDGYHRDTARSVADN